MRLSRDKKVMFLSIILLLVVCPTIKQSHFFGEENILTSTAENSKVLFLPPNQTNYELKEINQFDTGYGYPVDVEMVGDLAFTCAPRGGLFIFNVSIPTQPVLIGSYDEPKNITEDNYWSVNGGSAGLALKDDLLFLGDGLNGLVVLNISDPTYPQKIGYYSEGAVQDVLINGDYLYTLSFPGIAILNISIPTSPTFVTKIIERNDDPSSILYEFIIQDNHLLALNGSSGLIIYDITKPATPIEVSRTSFIPGKLAIKENLLFIITSPSYYNSFISQLVVIDISNYSLPQLVKKQQISEIDDYINDLLVYNTTLFVGVGTKLYAFELDAFFNSTFLSSITLGGLVRTFRVNHSYQDSTDYVTVYCANANKGLQMLDYSNISHPLLLSEYDFGGQTKEVYVEEQYVYLLSEHDWPVSPTEFLILHRTEEQALELVGKYSFTEQHINEVVISGKYAYLAGNGLTILNLSNPTSLSVVGQYSEGCTYTEAICYDPTREVVFIGDTSRGFVTLNVTDKTNPVRLSSGNPWSMVISDLTLLGNLLILGDTNYENGGFGLIDMSDPINPVYLHHHIVSEMVKSLYVEDNILYLSTQYTALFIFDITNREEPERIGYLYTGWWFNGENLVIKDGLAFLAREANGLLVIDVHKPSNPKLLLTYRDWYAGISYDVCVTDDYIFLADGWDGLEIYQLVKTPITKTTIILLATFIPSGILLVTGVFLLYQKKRKQILN